MARNPQPIDPQTNKPLPYYNLDVVAKFIPLTEASYLALYGTPLPQFDYFKPIKRWRESGANPALVNRPEFFLYDVATGADGSFQADKDGFCEPVKTGMSASEAWAINIPPDIGLGTVPGSTPIKEVRMPIELLPNERLQKQPYGGGLRVRRVDVVDPGTPAPAGSFTETDRAMLTAIYQRGK